MKNNIKAIIAQVITINEKYHEIQRLNGDNFNIFSILKMERDEVKTHSLFIYELINPKGSHNQGDLFLQLFLKEVLNISEKKKATCLQSKREDFTKDGKRIDFTIETEKYQIGIEMKIDADDQQNQLIDYKKELKNRCNNKQEVKLYYLTLTGYEASSKSTREELIAEKDYKLISFKSEILHWIEQCIEKSATIPTLREALVHYRNLIQKITNKLPQVKENEMENIIRDSKDIEAMHTITNSYPKIWAKKEMEFWDELWNSLTKKCKKFGFECNDYYEIWIDGDGNEYDEEKVIDNIIARRDKSAYSVGFVLEKVYQDNTYLRMYVIEWDETLSYYVALFDKNDKIIMNKSLEDIFKQVGFNRKHKDERYTYSKEKITFYGRYQPEPTYELFNEDVFIEYIEKITNEVCQYISALSKKNKQIEDAIE